MAQNGPARWPPCPDHDQIAGRHTEIECLRLLAARVLSTAEHHGVPGPEGSVAKLAWAQADQALAATAVDVLGLGALEDGWGHNLCTSRSLSIAGGTTEINKTIGLPRAPSR